MNGFEAIQKAKALLLEAGLDVNQNELNVLYEVGTGLRRPDARYTELTSEQEEQFLRTVRRRCAGEPLQYLCGDWPFLDFTVRVDARALIPRPETELLAERSAGCLKGRSPEAVLDLCSGTGVLAIALKRAFPEAAVTAVELSPEACSLIRENCEANGVQVEVVCADACEYPAVCGRTFDLIVCNPPYVTPEDYRENFEELKFEPEMAFLGGEDGLYFYRRLIPACIPILREDGYLTFEIGNEQGAAVTGLLRKNGYRDIRLLPDVLGIDRDTVAMAPCKSAGAGV